MKRLLRTLMVPLALLTVALGLGACDWLNPDFGNGSAGGVGLGCTVESCVFQSGNYLTVTISHTESMQLLQAQEICINSGQGDTCMANLVGPHLTGSFANIEYNAVLDSNCLYGVPLYGWCGYAGTYGIQERATLIALAWGGYAAVGGCVGFRINLFLLNYQKQSWFVTDPAGQGNPPGGSFCPF